MRDAARALDDVSDHLGEVLRHADELLAEWGRFGAQVRTQVEREAGAIGAVVDGAVERAASAGIDRAIADRLRGLSAELERLEQRTRAASRAVTEQRDADRRVLWIVVAGVVLANALLVVLLLRKPEPLRVPDPIRMEAVTAPPSAEPAHAALSAGSGDAARTGEPTPGPDRGAPGANAGASGGSSAGASGGSSAGASSGASGGASSGSSAGASSGSSAGASSGSNVAGAKPGAKTPADAANQGAAAGAGTGSAKPAASPIVLPQKPGAARVHKKLP
ncbi:MAG: hypothetical protein ABIY55_16400 [Kofleriaceae bacterium]